MILFRHRAGDPGHCNCVTRNFTFALADHCGSYSHPRQYATLQPGFECKTSPTAAAKSQSQKLTLLPPIPQTLFLLQACSAPKSVSVYGSPMDPILELADRFGLAGRRV